MSRGDLADVAGRCRWKRLAARLARRLLIPATGRGWRTVRTGIALLNATGEKTRTVSFPIAGICLLAAVLVFVRSSGLGSFAKTFTAKVFACCLRLRLPAQF